MMKNHVIGELYGADGKSCAQLMSSDRTLPYTMYIKFCALAFENLVRRNFTGARNYMDVALSQLTNVPEILQPDADTYENFKQRTEEIKQYINDTERAVV